MELSELYSKQLLATTVTGKLNQLQALAAEYWDFRKGVERQVTDWNDATLNQEGSVQWQHIFHAATQLGMVESSTPTNKHPDYLVILGGANRSPLDRLRFGIERVDSFAQLVYMGSDRPVSDAEREKAHDYAPDARTEFDLGCGAFETLLGAVPVKNVRVLRDGEEWGVSVYEFMDQNGDKKRAFALNSPQMIGENRATTYDNYAFLAETIGLEHYTDVSIVSVTTGFYVPAQHAPAIQQITLPYGVKVETIGHDAAYSEVKRLPTQLLQETKAAIDAYRRLSDRILLLHNSRTVGE